MTSQDIAVMREQLAEFWRQRWQLDVVEQAEKSVRAAYEARLQARISEMIGDLQDQGARVAEARRSQNLPAIIAAESKYGAMRREAQDREWQLQEQRAKAEEVAAAYHDTRAELQQRIHRLQRAIAKYTEQLDTETRLRPPSP